MATLYWRARGDLPDDHPACVELRQALHRLLERVMCQ